MYDLNDEPGFMEEEVAGFTHAFFPRDILEDVEIDGRFAFARHRNALVAFVARHPLGYAEGSRYDLIQQGRDGYWVFEAGSAAEEGGMEEFKKRIRSNPISCADRTLEYGSGGESLQLIFGGAFRVNDAVVNTEYKRFDSPYADCSRKPQSIVIAHDGHELELDFYGRRRIDRSSPVLLRDDD
jgi:hypothetical protein